MIFHYQKCWFHCRSETNHIVNENFSFPKRIFPFKKGQLIAFSVTKRFRIFFISVAALITEAYNLFIYFFFHPAIRLMVNLIFGYVNMQKFHHYRIDGTDIGRVNGRRNSQNELKETAPGALIYH